MCFGACRVTCDNCKPKFVYCPDCGKKNMLMFDKCRKCGRPLTQEMKDAAIADWEVKRRERDEKERAEQEAKLQQSGISS